MGKKLKTIAEKFKRKFVNWFGGDFILRNGWDRQLGFVCWCFLIVLIAILWNLMVEERMVQVVKNGKKIEDMEIRYEQATLDLVGLDRRTRIEGMLDKYGSTLKAPKEPATVIRREAR